MAYSGAIVYSDALAISSHHGLNGQSDGDYITNYGKIQAGRGCNQWLIGRARELAETMRQLQSLLAEPGAFRLADLLSLQALRG